MTEKNELVSSENLTKYMQHVYELEKSVYEQKQIAGRLKSSIHTLESQLKLQPDIYEERGKEIGSGIAMAITSLIISILLYWFYSFLRRPDVGGFLLGK